MASLPEFNNWTEASTVAASFPSQIKGKVFLITGVSPNGLGQSTAEALAPYDPGLLVLTGRTESKVLAVIDNLSFRHPNVRCQYLHLDLSSLASVRNAAQKVMDDSNIPQIDVVICNAGVMFIPERQLSADGIKMQFATNDLGHFLLVNLILKKLIIAAGRSPAGTVRVVNVSSEGHQFSPVRFSDPNSSKGQSQLPERERATINALEMYFGPQSSSDYNPYVAYGQSKSANILFSQGLTMGLFERFGIKSYALHPGGILTDLWRHMDNSFVQKLVDGQQKVGGFKTLEQGSSTTFVAALDPQLPTPTATGGKFYLDDCQLTSARHWARGFENAERLWTLSEDLIGERFVL